MYPEFNSIVHLELLYGIPDSVPPTRLLCIALSKMIVFWSYGNIRLSAFSLMVEIFGHMGFIHSVIQFWSNDPVFLPVLQFLKKTDRLH